MSNCSRAFRFGIKKGVGVPTIPVSSDHQNGDWIDTDIYEGEMYQDTDTGYVYTRSGTTIVPSSVSAFVVTQAEAVTLATAGELVAGASYQLSDKDISIHASTADKFCTAGCRTMRIVKNTYYTIAGINLGVWNSTLTPLAGDITVWGGKVWSNVAGAVGSDTDYETLSADWTLIATTNGTYYEDKSFFILYDFNNAWVAKQYDDRGNVFGAPYDGGINYLTVCDWGNDLITNNNVVAIYNNSNNNVIDGNSNFGSITGNSNVGGIQENLNIGSISANTNTGAILYNKNKGAITLNSCQGIESNSNNGNISTNSNAGFITENQNNGNISTNSNDGNIQGNLNNGYIINIAVANTNVEFNINNGYISTTTTGVISDTIVNK